MFVLITENRTNYFLNSRMKNSSKIFFGWMNGWMDGWG
jgi:hypothetical protein